MIKAKVVGDIPANRMIILTRPNENKDIIHIRVSGELNSPEFVSTKDLEDKERVNIKISDNRVWEVEAGEDIEAGVPIVSGKDGVAVRDIRGNEKNPSWIGYTIESANKGEIVKIVRRDTVSLPWSTKIDKRITDLEVKNV